MWELCATIQQDISDLKGAMIRAYTTSTSSLHSPLYTHPKKTNLENVSVYKIMVTFTELPVFAYWYPSISNVKLDICHWGENWAMRDYLQKYNLQVELYCSAWSVLVIHCVILLLHISLVHSIPMFMGYCVPKKALQWEGSWKTRRRNAY